MNLVHLVLAMALVTYIPRMLPLVLLRHAGLPPFIKRFMVFIPYAALGALIFPSVLSSTGRIETALAGCIAAILLSWLEVNLVFVISGGIMAALLTSLL